MPAEGEHTLRAGRALSHPLRISILQAMGERVMSPKELAGHLDEPLSRVNYHVRLLAELDWLLLERTRSRRGAIEHFYRAVDPGLYDRVAAAVQDGRDGGGR
jgi:DNA-binding transcriptional ArsR family regulator